MGTVQLTIDGYKIEADESKTVLEAALDNGIYIPHLCHHENLHPNGGCRLCVVKQDGVDGVITSCSTKVKEGMVIHTKDEQAEAIRKLSCDFMFKTHPTECTGCPKYGKCQLASISQYVGDTGRDLRYCQIRVTADESNPLMLHEMHRCILCGRCVRACNEMRGVGALKFEKVDGRMRVVINGDSLEEAGCRFCGACVEVCPTGSIRDKVGVFDDNLPKERALVPCREACPAHVNVPKYIRYINEGNYAAAAATVREKVPFPETLGYVCVHDCEANCKRNFLNGAVSIRNLKRYAASQDDGSWKKNAFQKPNTGKKVAVIGSGPAGLTVAYYMRKLGHEVTVFEKLPKAGGQMRYGIPSYRLPREVLDAEIAEIEAIGVKIECNSEVKSAVELKKDYDVVYAAIGTHAGNKLPLENNDLPDVYLNADFLRAENLGNPLPVGENVVVLGGGNVAIDCAETAVRLGAKHVVMTCLEAPDKMTASAEEVTWAKEDGIIVENSRTFDAIVAENGKVTGLTVTGIEGLKFGPKGPEFTRIPDSTVTFPADTVIFAVGQHPDVTEEFGVELNRGRIVVNPETFATNIKGIYASGDCVTGTRSVIQAVGEARLAVSAMDQYLGGDGNIEENLAPEQDANPCIGKATEAQRANRTEPRTTDAADRVKNFEPMDLGFDCSMAGCEADRCLQCDLRLQIAPQKFWSDYVPEEGGAE